ncbi:hypothetical protein ABS71_03235 [bacterium SCN 62-11]|nr:hypothetical protein [Candidatus Eremiobacteraeota bacterium]ODT76618.1 MAG: hypothetical protein ABS71_03235 [bacterium SCN 62-11]
MIELILSLALLALGAVVLAQGFINLRGSRVHVKAEAEQLAELMRTLRQQAITENRPLGLGFPTQGGSRAVSNGYYQLEGEHHPKVLRRVTMARERSVQLSGCFWPEMPFTQPPSSTLSNSSYKLNNWQVPFPQDGVLMFLPSGEVLTNLPTVQGEAAVVLGYAIEAAPGNVGGQPAMQLQRVKGPVVVWCSLFGEVRLEGGLGSAPARVAEVVAAGDSADLPGLTSSSNGNPIFVNQPLRSAPLEVSPPANLNTLSAVANGMSGTIRRKRYLSLKVTARDPDGDALWCTWKQRSGVSGTFTKTEDVRMIYDPKDQMWVATWAWHPPDGAVPGDEFPLEATIEDHRGGSATLSGLISGGGQFRILTPGKLAFRRGTDIWISNWDGSDPVIVARNLTRPRWSRDAGAIVCMNGSFGLSVVTPDGRRRTDVCTVTGATWLSPGSFNAYNNRIVVASESAGVVHLGEVTPWDTAQTPSDWPVDHVLTDNIPPGSRPVVDCKPGDVNQVLVSPSGGAPGPMVLIDKSQPGNSIVLPMTGSEASFCSSGEIVYRSADGQVTRAPLGGPVGATASLSNAHFPRSTLDSSGNGPVVVSGDDGGENCLIYQNGNTLTGRLKLFSFPETCTEPDFAY